MRAQYLYFIIRRSYRENGKLLKSSTLSASCFPNQLGWDRVMEIALTCISIDLKMQSN